MTNNATQDFSSTKGPKVYRVDAHVSGEFDRSPTVAMFDVDESLARDITSLASLVYAADANKIERFYYRAQYLQYDPETSPEDAQQAGQENSVRTEIDCLVVTSDAFFFRAYIKHTDVSVECAQQSVAELAAHFELPYRKPSLPKTTLNVDVQPLITLAQCAASHVEDIESGIEEGMYSASENADITAKRDALEHVQSLIRVLQRAPLPAQPRH